MTRRPFVLLTRYRREGGATWEEVPPREVEACDAAQALDLGLHSARHLLALTAYDEVEVRLAEPVLSYTSVGPPVPGARG